MPRYTDSNLFHSSIAACIQHASCRDHPAGIDTLQHAMSNAWIRRCTWGAVSQTDIASVAYWRAWLLNAIIGDVTVCLLPQIIPFEAWRSCKEASRQYLPQYRHSTMLAASRRSSGLAKRSTSTCRSAAIAGRLCSARCAPSCGEQTPLSAAHGTAANCASSDLTRFTGLLRTPRRHLMGFTAAAGCQCCTGTAWAQQLRSPTQPCLPR
jgi:hypothetical protein